MNRFSASLALACLLLLCIVQAAAASGSGIVMAWGKNDYGQLGDGTTTDSSLPLKDGGLAEAVAVAGGARHAAALKVGGTVWAWGDNTYGQLGDGTADGSLAPVQVTGAAGTALTGITAIACGANHTAALKSDGSVWAWGANSAGQLGNGSADAAAHPYPSQAADSAGAGFLGNIAAIACGQDFTVALSSAGTVLAWGKNDHGQLGNNTTSDSSLPVSVGSLSGVVAIAAGAAHAAALKSDGTVWAWGVNDHGQLGNNSTTDSGLPVQVNIPVGAVAIACGAAHSLALMPDGTVWAWGDNTHGQLGNGTAAGSLTPVQVTGPAQTGYLTGVTAVAAGAHHSAVLTTGGAVLTWGGNGGGQLGDGTSVDRYAPVQVGGLTDAVAVACGPGQTLAIAPAPAPDIVMSWGYNKFGQLGDGTTEDSGVPIQSAGASGIKSIADGFAHSIALKSDGTVWSWGSDFYGQLGDGNTVNACSAPVQASLAGIKAVAGGQYHTLALGPDGTVRACGYNCYGQLGTGNTASSSLPVNIASLAGVKAITCGGGHSVALKSDGTVWAWGNNNCGQLGNGTTNNRFSPFQVKGPGGNGFLAGVSAIARGNSHTVALKSDGTVWAWGFNTFGDLGDGSTLQRNTPVQARGLTGVVAIASGYYHTLALRADGTVWAWGRNDYGQLGDGTTVQRNTPVQVKGLDGVIAIAGGSSHAVALKSDGTVWAWGSNTNGQLGDGTKNSSSVPVRVVGLTGVTGVAAGDNYTSALLAAPDTTAPTSAITSPSNGITLAGAAYNITGAADDGSGSGVQEVEVSIDGGTWAKASGSAIWSYSWTLPADGNYVIKCRATDNAGNVEAAGTGITVSVDNTAPVSVIASYPGDAGAGSSWFISGTASDAVSGVRKVEVSIDGGVTWHTASGTAAWSYSCLPPTLGSYSIMSRATDNAGNVESPGMGVNASADGLDLMFQQDGRRVTLGAKGFSRGKPLAGKAMTFKASLYDIVSGAWGAWSVLGPANSGADGTVSSSYIMENDGTYRFTVECPAGAAVMTSPPSSNCVIHPPTGLSPASGSVTGSRTPAVNWTAFMDAMGNAVATGYELQASADPNFTLGVSYIDMGNATTANLPQTNGVMTWWRIVALLPNGRSVASAAASITYRVKTSSLSWLSLGTSGRIIMPSVTFAGDGSGRVSGKKILFYYEESAAAAWKFAGQARTDSGGTARMAPLALAAGTYDLKAIIDSGPGLSPGGSEVMSFTLP